MKYRTTQWDKWIKILQDKGISIQDVGGSGFILPRLAKFNDKYITKVRDLKKLYDLTKGKEAVCMTKKKRYNDKSDKISDWSTRKLKKEAQLSHQTIFVLETFSTHDLLTYDGIIHELEQRGIEPKTMLIF